jgi:hypothetical protein
MSWVMASIDCEEDRRGPKTDLIGISLFAIHAGVSTYLMCGWIVSSIDSLAFYLLLLPVIALQWHVNLSSCVLNNFESWLRTGCWRHPSNREEGGFLLMLSDWLFGVRPSAELLNGLAYATLVVLWTVGAAHLFLLV